jgi:ABC-type lipoprotein export system ATPase subunit
MMLRASREGRTLVIATHHGVAAGLASRVVTMRDGSVETGS